MPAAHATDAAQRKLDYVLPGLGLGALALGILLAALTAQRIAAYLLLAVSVALFAAALRRTWRRRAAQASAAAASAKALSAKHPVPPADAAEVAHIAVAPPEAPDPPAGPQAVQAPAPALAAAPVLCASVAAPGLPAPAGAATAPAGGKLVLIPGNADADLRALLDSTVVDLLQAALLKDPAHVRRLRQMLAALPAPAAPPSGASAVAPASAA